MPSRGLRERVEDRNQRRGHKGLLSGIEAGAGDERRLLGWVREEEEVKGERKGGGVGERDTPGGVGVSGENVCVCVSGSSAAKGRDPQQRTHPRPHPSQLLEQLARRLRPEPPVRAHARPGRGGALGEGAGPGQICPLLAGLGNRQSGWLGLEKNDLFDLGK